MHVTLFFTRNTALKNWDSVGMLDREVALYRKYIEAGVRVSFVTYGRKDRRLYQDRLEGIEILCNEQRLPPALYAAMIPMLHASTLKKTDVVKSNQTPGALTALRSARLHKKPMLARCGYMHSEFIEKEHGAGSPLARKALDEELKLFSRASAIEVTTPMMQQSIVGRIPAARPKINVVPNYVDTDLFAPREAERDIDLLFIGRLTPQKNLFAMLEALHGLKMKTVIIGKGALEEQLKKRAEELGLDIHWAGNVPNPELPGYLNRSKLFVLPSNYEGHPKTLIEAMAAGLPVIGSNVPGIREVVTHLKNGWLTSTEPASTREALLELSASASIRAHLAKNARHFAVENYSLDHIAQRELMLLEQTARQLSA